MNRFCALIVLLSVIISSLSSCTANVQPIKQQNITITSSDADKYALWLENRLEYIPDSLIIGIGNCSEYGIDTSSLMDDGYIIRTLDGSTVIFGKTDVGLDLACRRYANDIELYGTAKSTVFHEGNLVEELLLFGCPISDFAVICPEDAAHEIAEAASEFSRIVQLLCGSALPILTTANAGKTVSFVLSENGSYGYSDNNGNLVFNIGNKNYATQSVYDFFENEASLFGIAFSEEIAYEQDLVSILAGISKSVNPAFDSFSLEDRAYFPLANEGTVCFSDENYYNSFRDAVKEYINNCDRPTVIGIDTGDSYCGCNICEDILALEKSTAGSAVRFANRLCSEFGSDLTVNVYTNDTAVITAPSSSVNIVLSQTDICSSHPMTDSNCGITDNNGFYNTLTEWAKLTDNVCVKLYSAESSLIQKFGFDTLRENIRILHRIGIKELIVQNSDCTLGFDSLESKLAYYINRDLDMTDDEYKFLTEKLLCAEYGDGWNYVWDYFSVLQDAYHLSCTANTKLRFNTTFLADCFDTSSALLEKSLRLSTSSSQEKSCLSLSCHTYYMGCLSSYFEAYHTLDQDRILALEYRYSLLMDRLSVLGFDIGEISGTEPSISPILYDAAWKDWSKLEYELYTGEKLSLAYTDEMQSFVEAVGKNTGTDKLTFAFRTDTHYTTNITEEKKKSIMLNSISLLSIERYIDIDFIAHGGDILNGNEPSKGLALQSLNEIVSYMRGIHTRAPQFFLRGNHDDNSWYGYEALGCGRYDYPADTIINTEDWLGCTNDNSSAFVRNGNSAYGYFDHEESKIRVLLLDPCDLPYSLDNDGNYRYGSYTGQGMRQEQLQFMADAMMFSDKGDDASEWAILVLSHVPVETMKTTASAYRFGGLEITGRNFYAFLRILKAYQRGVVFSEKQTSRTNYGDGGYNIANNTENDTHGDFAYDVYADYSGNGPGEVIGIISGHTHIDNYSNEVGKVSYSGNGKIYPKLSYGYSYISSSSGGLTVFTVDRNGDGTGSIHVNRLGTTTVPRKDMITDGDNSVVTKDKTAAGVVSSTPASGSIASGQYTVNYYQNR